MTQNDRSDERRADPRAKTLKGAQIVYRDGNCVMDCLISNLSEGGAKLKPSDIFACPDTFELRIKDAPARRCRIVRRSGSEVAVEFLE
ncbi:MAG: PilZ domain-containing protein [Kiloniellales bacterium]